MLAWFRAMSSLSPCHSIHPCASIDAAIASCKRAIIFRRRAITLSIFANFPLCGLDNSTRRPRPPLPISAPAAGLSAFQAGISNHPLRSVIVFVSQFVISHSGTRYGYLQPASRPACPSARSPSPPSSHLLPSSSSCAALLDPPPPL